MIDTDETLEREDNLKARKVLTTLRKLSEENPGWAYDYDIIASYSGVGQNAIRATVRYLVANVWCFRSPRWRMWKHLRDSCQKHIPILFH